MKIKETTFGQLKRGDRFALGRGAFKDGTDDFMNMKVDSAVLCDSASSTGCRGELVLGHIPFNVIGLGDGRVRTFRDEEKVLVLEESDD